MSTRSNSEQPISPPIRPSGFPHPTLWVFVCLAAGLLSWRAVVYWRGIPAQTHINRGLTAAEAGRPLEAEREWKLALSADWRREQPYILLAQLYMNGGRADLAIPLLERLRQLNPRYPHGLCTLANAYTQVEETAKGQKTARQATLLERNCANAHALLGIHLGEQQDSRGALTELSKAAALAPEDHRIALSLAQAQLDASNLEAAEAIARRVLRENPEYPTAWYTLARSYARRTPTKANCAEAIRAYERALALNPALADAYAEIGRLRLATGDVPGAIRPLEHLYQRGVRSKEALFNLAAAYRRLGKSERADRLAAEFREVTDFETRYLATQKRFSLDPTNLDVATELAEMHTRAGKMEEALPMLEAVLKARPKDRRTLKLASLVYDRLGEREMAGAVRSRLTALPSP